MKITIRRSAVANSVQIDGHTFELNGMSDAVLRNFRYELKNTLRQLWSKKR